MPFKDPAKARESMRRSYLANRDERIARASARNRANPEAHRAAQRGWRESERGRAMCAAEYARNAEDYKRRAREWADANPERRKQIAYDAEVRRRLRVRAQYVEYVDPFVVLERDDGVCGICGEDVDADFHVDHIVSIARGGEHSYANVQTAHPLCNIRKGAGAHDVS